MPLTDMLLHAVSIMLKIEMLPISLHVEDCRRRHIRCLHVPALPQTSGSRTSELKEQRLRMSLPASSTSVRRRRFIRGCGEYATILNADNMSDGFQFCVEDILQ